VEAGSGGTVMLPFTAAVVPTIDLAAGRLVVDPPAGAFG
jgi:16S rRNA processing protein RimM